jgi:hypothetical protein
MNLSETSTEWSSVPDVYEVEIRVSPKFTDINLGGNVTTAAAAIHNDTFTFQGMSLF